ncbi:phosphoribosyl-ATP diphosphatase [Sphingomonas spermidinifaciens]|uniref:Phosphoribosyl-ATP pyrophosphatase n=1 Tax=Sphingomonas spermidinifaciens TaxID=1141889 RepID=A0A2A4AZU1_9SPHN|nr:phosphoribosyl-ATP diphosphatase [Sphingomonas spermidinifaciens]
MTNSDPLDALEAVIRSRRGGDASASYVAALFEKGRAKIAQKVGEEAVETAIAAVQGDRAALKGEAADLLFHLIVLLVDAGLRLDDVRAELARREGLSGLVEKAARTAPPPPAPVEPPPPAAVPLPLGQDEGAPTAAPLQSGSAETGRPRPLPSATGGF